MGRKNWKEFVSQKGPGRKARKQKDPELPLKLQEQEKEIQKVKKGTLGSRAKQRSKKRVLKEAAAKALLPQKKTPVKKTSVKKKVTIKTPPEEEDDSSPKQNLKINLFQETSDGVSDGLQETSDSSNGEESKAYTCMHFCKGHGWVWFLHLYRDDFVICR